MFADTILGFKGAVVGEVLWRVAFPTETRGRDTMIIMKFGHL